MSGTRRAGVGGHFGLSDSTRRIVVAELRALADEFEEEEASAHGGASDAYSETAMRLRARADEIEKKVGE